MIVVFIIMTLISLFYSFRCFMPRFENKNQTSVIYFGDIVSDFAVYADYHEYLEKAVVDDAQMSMQLAEQIHTNSSIAAKKMKAVNMAMRYMMSAVFLLIMLVGLLILFCDWIIFCPSSSFFVSPFEVLDSMLRRYEG